jgi:hypothetical protein
VKIPQKPSQQLACQRDRQTRWASGRNRPGSRRFSCGFRSRSRVSFTDKSGWK